MALFEKEVQIVKNLMPKVSDILLHYFKTSLKIEYKNSNFSPVTAADKEAENLIRRTLSKAFPSYGFIGEETEEDIKDISWIVDPLDGTAAFTHGIDDFGIAIALKAEKDVILSVLCVPTKKTIYHAQRNQGSFCNDKLIKISTVSENKLALVSFGYENIRDVPNQPLSLKIATNHRVRIGHSSLIESTYLANGNIDAVVKFNQKIWDLAPEYLIMKEAGAKITNIEGKEIELEYSKTSTQSYIASNGFIHDDLVRIANEP